MVQNAYGHTKLVHFHHFLLLVLAHLYIHQKFLDFTYKKGNDLITPRDNFRGLKPGDKWCLCVMRWIEAYNYGVAPFIDLNSTSENVLKYVPYDILIKFSYNLF